MQTYVAELSEIIRCEQRDEEHLEKLSKEASLIIKDLFGSSFWIRYYRYIPVVTKILYYSFTTLSGVQTLGEEYLSLLQVSDRRERRIPSFLRRLFFVILHVITPLGIEELIRLLERRISNPTVESFLNISLRNNYRARESFRNIIDWLRVNGLPSLRRIHLAYFYLFGSYYNISKRISGIGYISLRSQSNIEALWLFRFLGYLTLLQSALSTFVWALDIFANYSIQELKSDNYQDSSENSQEEGWQYCPKFRCPICLLNNPPACTPCGHLFCWHCIIEHAVSTQRVERSLPKCPQCRTEYEPSRIVPIVNL